MCTSTHQPSIDRERTRRRLLRLHLRDEVRSKEKEVGPSLTSFSTFIFYPRGKTLRLHYHYINQIAWQDKNQPVSESPCLKRQGKRLQQQSEQRLAKNALKRDFPQMV